MSRGRHRKPGRCNGAALVGTVGLIGTTAGMMLTAAPASAAGPSGPAVVADTAIARVAANAGLPSCRGVPLGTWVAVALAESGGNARARNAHGEDSRGLWQINARVHTGWLAGRNLYDPATNAWAAKKVCDSQGVRAWSAYTNGSYRRHLARGNAAAAAAKASPASMSTTRSSAPVPPVSGISYITRNCSLPASTATVRNGSKMRTEVAAVQRRLTGIGYPLTVDGIFGPQTTRVVKEYQRRHGLAADGTVGARTYAQLFPCG
ncbi:MULTISPECIES: peptidoglycan-binding protein [unclassified Frankia]|uniref:peptidoglycan-binding protein n=1 Tax=unclassified Frankia TaxID=2632575 RepID=UPI002024E796